MKKKNMNKGQRTLDPTQDKCDTGCNVISAGGAVPRKPQRIVPWPQDRKGACVHCETLQFSLLYFLWVFFTFAFLRNSTTLPRPFSQCLRE